MEIHPLCNLLVVNRIAELSGDKACLAWMREHISPGLDTLKALLARPGTSRFCHGDTPGFANCCLVPQLYNARRWKLDPATWPTIARMSTIPARNIWPSPPPIPTGSEHPMSDMSPLPILYGYPCSPPSMRMAIALKLKGIAYREVKIDLPAGVQRSGPGNLNRGVEWIIRATSA